MEAAIVSSTMGLEIGMISKFSKKTSLSIMKKEYLKLLNLNGTILKECLQHWGDSLLAPDVGL